MGRLTCFKVVCAPARFARGENLLHLSGWSISCSYLTRPIIQNKQASTTRDTNRIRLGMFGKAKKVMVQVLRSASLKSMGQAVCQNRTQLCAHEERLQHAGRMERSAILVHSEQTFSVCPIWKQGSTGSSPGRDQPESESLDWLNEKNIS